jgi:radical SAM protein with 4Fe4S-binding SPASM domain
MCYQYDKLGSAGELSLEEIRHVIDQLPPWCVLSLTGGEPFIRDDFGSMLEYGLDRRKCTILTNASLVTDDHIELITRKKLLLFSVSIDGVGDTHDRVRKIPGLLSKVVETISKIQEHKKRLKSAFPIIDMKTVILKENIDQLYDILELGNRLSVDYVTYSVARSTENLYGPPYREDIRDICQAPSKYPHLEADELARLTRQVSRIGDFSGRTKVRFYPANMLDGRLLGRFYRQELSPPDFRTCLLPWSRMSISPHGDAYPCLSYLVGNVRRESLSRIWNGDRFREFRKNLDRKSLSHFCLSCCNSVCRAGREGA